MLWHSELSCHLQYQHAIWVPVQVPATSFQFSFLLTAWEMIQVSGPRTHTADFVLVPLMPLGYLRKGPTAEKMSPSLSQSKILHFK